MKSTRKNKKIKNPIRRAGKYIRAWHSKQPIFTVIGVLSVVAVLCGTSYGAYRYVANQTQKNQVFSTVNQNETKAEDNLNDINTNLKDTKADSLKKASKTKKDYSDPRAPTLTTGAGCITCDNNPSYSIITSFKSTTMKAGSTIGPFTARTSDGSKVIWSTPASGKDWSPYSYINGTTFHNLSSITFFIRAETNVKPGTYQMQMTAVDGAKSTRARHFATITVTEKAYFTVTRGPAAIVYSSGDYYLSLPLQLNRYNGHNESVSMSAEVKCPNNTIKYFDHNWSIQSSPRLVGPINNFSVPNTCTITMDTIDASHQSEYKETVNFTVN